MQHMHAYESAQGVPLARALNMVSYQTEEVLYTRHRCVLSKHYAWVHLIARQTLG